MPVVDASVVVDWLVPGIDPELPTIQVRRRLKDLLGKLKGTPTADDLRQLRAVHALELCGTAEARQLLQQFMHEFKPEQVKRYLAREVIGGLPNAAAIDLSQFAGLFDASTVNVVEPAVIEAPQAAILDTPIAQIGSAVGAMNAEQARPILLIAKQHQVLAEQSDLERRSTRRQLFAERRWLPVPPHQLARGHARPDPREPLVLFFRQHPGSISVS